MLTAMLWPKAPAAPQNVFSKQSGWSVRLGAAVGSNRLSVTLGLAPNSGPF